MTRFLSIGLIIIAATVFGTTSATPALAGCGPRGMGNSDGAPKKCPMCEKMGERGMNKEMMQKMMCQMCIKKKMMKDIHHNMLTHSWSSIHEAVAVLHATQGNTATGVVRFLQVGPHIKITADVRGLEPNSTHAIHVHQYGDCTLSNGKSAGGHYNPEGHPHALPDSDTRHAGDLGNLQADGDGNAHYETIVDNISLVGHRNPILGRGVIVHAKADDGGQPTGNAGARIAYGVIGIANSPANKPPAATQPTTKPSR